MAALTGTVVNAGRSGERGQQFVATGTYALTGALVNADTITWSNFFPSGKFKLVSLEVYGPELDTNATPTMKFKIGDGTTVDAYLTEKGGALGLQNSLPSQLFYKGDGASIGTSFTGLRNLVMTVTAAVATGATSGTIFVEAVVEGV